MERKSFIKNCASACLHGVAITGMLQGCSGSRILTGKIGGDDLLVAIKDFEVKNGNNVYYRKYVIVQNELLRYPICVYRFNDHDYTALWMQCTHQGTELQVFGDKLQCPAHGSEFDSQGGIRNGPAEAKLRTFPVTVANDLLKISLKAVS